MNREKVNGKENITFTTITIWRRFSKKLAFKLNDRRCNPFTEKRFEYLLLIQILSVKDSDQIEVGREGHVSSLFIFILTWKWILHVHVCLAVHT